METRFDRDEADLDQTIKVKSPGSGMMAFNRYRLDRVLGRGGMGIVWLAEDQKLERQVALKFLPSLIGLDPAAVKELKTETRRGLELSHPNIVRIYDFVDDEEAAAISMEYINGQTLSDLRMTRDKAVFSVNELSNWLVGVCDALDYAHFQRKVVHRDLKPANIMVTADNCAKIADFGIARSLSDTMSRLSAAQHGTSGTLPYMSPQQAMGERPLPTDDVYSLGATIYELLSGKPPFYRGDLPMQINSKIPTSMKERREELEITGVPDIPQEWEWAIAQCLHKDPTQRPPSAGALAEMIGLKPATTLSRTMTASGNPATAAPAPRFKRSHLLAACAAVLVVGGAAAALLLGGGEPPPEPPVVEIKPAAPAEPPALTAAAADAPSPAPLPATATAPLTPEAAPAVVMQQPPAIVPTGGFWTLKQIFPMPPQSAFSEKGKAQLLFKAQELLKQKGHYASAVDGEEGKGTHNAIVLFQVSSGLIGNGFLDGPTLKALALDTLPDDPTWTEPNVASSSSSSSRKRSSSKSKDQPNMLERAGKSIGKLFGR
jgi:predicted Ser/Thr protein kinase